jgi:hypothetical protein
MNNIEKHNLAISLLSQHMNWANIPHSVEKDSEYDFIVNGNKKIKVFCNYSGSAKIKLKKDYSFSDDVLYMVVKPTNRNNVGYTSSGIDGEKIDSVIVHFKGNDSFINLDLDKMKPTNLIRRFSN